MHFSDVEVGKQLIVGNGTYYDALGLGGNVIRGSAYIEGPFLVGDAKSFGEVVATTMIARDVNEESNNPPRSLHVKGNTKIKGDGGTANMFSFMHRWFTGSADVKFSCRRCIKLLIR